jgi:hypothetical protein
MRESSKANWVRGDRTLRRPMLELGRRLSERGLIAEPADIFWLVGDEVEQALTRPHDAADMRATVLARKEEAERMRQLDLPEVFPLPVEVSPTVPAMDGSVAGCRSARGWRAVRRASC